MKKTILWYLLLLVVTMFLLPWLTVLFVSDGAMAICFMLFYLFNPMLSLFVGVYSGMNLKKAWYFPILLSVAFLAGVWISFTTTEIMFAVYSITYLIIGGIAMLLTWGVRKLLGK